MSILDILTNGPLGQVLDTMKTQGGLGGLGNLGNLGDIFGGGSSDSRGSGSGLGGAFGSALESIAKQARTVGGTISSQTPGGMGGLLGAGALGAVLGNLMSSSAVKGVALAGATAVAWNFYKKWAEGQKDGEEAKPLPTPDGSRQAPAQALPQYVDPTAQLVLRSMIYAAKADGNIDNQERERINAVLKSMLPGENLDAAIAQVSAEPLDPARIASSVRSQDQADDVYRLSCSTIDIDHFMERGYLDALAKALNISPAERKQIEAEATQAKKQLEAAVGM